MRITPSAIVMASVLASPALMAQEGKGRFELGIVEVTGQPLAELEYPSVERLTDEDLRRHDRYDVSEALNLLPGVTLQNIGGRSERLIFIRGFNSRQVPLFIDGIPVYVPYDGNIDLSRMTTFDLSEIRVTKGFTSVLYGPNTLGGSINLISRRPTEKLEGNLSGGVGFDSNMSPDLYRTDLNLGTNQGLWYAQVGGSWMDRSHFRLSDGFSPTAIQGSGRRVNSASMDYKVNLKLGFTPNETDEYSISYYNQRGEKQTPPYAGSDPGVRTRFWRWPEYDKQSVYFLSQTGFGDGHYMRLRAYYDKFDNTLKSFDDDTFTIQDRPFAFTSIYDDYTFGGGVEFGFNLFERHLLKTAFSYKRDVHKEQDDVGEPWERFEDETISVGIEDIFTVTDKWRLIGGLSYNRQKGLQADQKLNDGTIVPFPLGTDSAFNIQIGTFYEIVPNTEIYFTFGRKTRFPTIKDRYSGRLGSALPAPDLKAEESFNYEIGVDGRWRSFDYGFAVFYSQLFDAIDNVSLADTACISPPCSQLQNITEQHHIGFETQVTWYPLHNLTLHANYTYLSKRNVSDRSIKTVDIPRHKVFGYAEYSLTDALRFIASIDYNSRRLSDTFGRRVADSFVVANLKAAYQFYPGLTGEIGVNNVADRNYAYEEGFFEPGRNYFANIHYRF
jgi:iron complex outermembrane recepter protein